MLWRIGALTAIEEQVAWVREAGFRGVGFHAHAGEPGRWSGLDPLRTDARDRARWRRELADFAWIEVHAPFSAEIAAGKIETTLPVLTDVLRFGRDVGASVVTAHARLSDASCAREAEAIAAAMRDLNREAATCGLVIGLEVVDGFDTISGWSLPNVGITLDVGHWAKARADGGPAAGRDIDGAIRDAGARLVHLHLHDVLGEVDHLELGTGEADLEAALRALRGIGYEGGLCLEMNPDRVSPDGTKRSLAFLRSRLEDARYP